MQKKRREILSEVLLKSDFQNLTKRRDSEKVKDINNYVAGTTRCVYHVYEFHSYRIGCKTSFRITSYSKYHERQAGKKVKH